MRHIRYLFLLLCAVLSTGTAAAAQSAVDVMSRAASRLSEAKSMTASFRLVSGTVSASGRIMTKGARFAILSDAGSSWYDGVSMWTYSPATAETTLVKPTATDLLETNPLLYIRNSSAFKAMYTKTQPQGKKRIMLVPRKKMAGIMNIEVTLNATSLLPEQIVVTTQSAGKMTVTVSNIKLNAALPDSRFVYPESKYPKIKIIDLR